MKMKRIAFGVFLFCALNLWAGEGFVQTTDGRRFEGQIQLEGGDTIGVAATNQAVTRITLNELSLLRFQTSSPPVTLSATGLVQGVPGTNSSTPDTNGSDEARSAPVPVPEPTGRPKSPAGVLLTSGSLIARRIVSADDTTVHFFASTNEMALSTVNVARIYFQPLPSDLERRLPAERSGLLLSNQEFVEGQFKSYSDGQIKINSVLFGLKSYDPGQVIAVILRNPKPAATRYEVRTRDESRFLASTIRIENESIVLQDPALPGLRIASAELLELSVH